MRGGDQTQSNMFSYISPEKRVPPDHPLRAVRTIHVLLREGSERGRFIQHDTKPYRYSLNLDWQPKASRDERKLFDATPLRLALNRSGRLSINGHLLTEEQTVALGDFMIARKDDWG